MKPAEKIIQKVRRGVQTVAYGNLLYQKILASGEVPDRLYFTLPDLWPGDAQIGLGLMTDQHSFFDRPALPRSSVALRNLHAVGTDAARRMCLRLIENWLMNHDQWNDVEWSPEILGERIAAWIGFYEFYAPAAPPDFIARITASLNRQWKHLMRTLPPLLTGVAGIRAIKGLIYGGLNFPDGDKALGVACDMLRRQLAAEILPDGGHVSRNPSTQLHVLRHLIDLRAAFRAAEIQMPESLQASITAMIPPLKFFRHGDGGLALFNGGIEETGLMIDAVLARAESRSRVMRRLPDTGYEKLTSGRSCLIADCAPPPLRGYDRFGHAGLLSFEFGHGRERIIVNCGTVENGNAEWRMACAATAAHSTVTIEDTNAAEILASGGIVCAAQVTAQRYEEAGMQGLEMVHDAYRAQFGVTHHRLLSLSTDGEELHGRDTISCTTERQFTLRWHLHPTVQASHAQSGQAALLRTPSGMGWRLRVDNAAIELEPGIYCGSGMPRRSLQLKVSGRTNRAPLTLVWTLTREKKN